MAPIIGLELPGTGVHPAAWRRADSRAEELFTAGYWVDAVAAAESAGIDLVFLPDSFALQPGGARGRLDAVAIAARAAAATHRVGLVPEVAVTHTEPFHVSKAIASLDFATRGRAGWQVAVSKGQANLFGRKAEQDAASRWREADEVIDVVTRLWDSWEDDAEIRDLATGRFIDREKLHYVDFVGEHFSVKGPSITPRPPQGQPLVAIRDQAHNRELAARRADLIRVPSVAAVEQVRAAIVRAGRGPSAVRVLVDVTTHIARTDSAAADEVAELGGWAAGGVPAGASYVGAAGSLSQFLAGIAEYADGVVLRPLAQAAFVDRLPSFAPTLRTRLGFERPANRYATID